MKAQIKNILAIAGSILVCTFATTVAADDVDYAALYNEVNKQEQTLVFDQFTNENALELGMQMVNDAKKEGLSITIDIMRNGQQLFHVALQGTMRENDHWIQRKNEVTNRSYQSSLKMWYWQEQGWMEDSFHMDYLKMWGLTAQEAMNLGGAFPLTVKNVGVIGTITVSGLAHDKDHAFAVKSINKYLVK